MQLVLFIAFAAEGIPAAAFDDNEIRESDAIKRLFNEVREAVVTQRSIRVVGFGAARRGVGDITGRQLGRDTQPRFMLCRGLAYLCAYSQGGMGGRGFTICAIVPGVGGRCLSLGLLR